MKETLLILMTLFITKHFLVDFLLQNAYQWRNKGSYLHPGGILHAGLHAGSTCAILWFFAPAYALLMSLFDGIVHYHVDFLKMNINRNNGWSPTTHEEFWWLMGFDQYVHYMTYVAIIAVSV